MMQLKIVADKENDLREQQRALKAAFVAALSPRLVISADVVARLQEKYACSLLKLQRFFKKEADQYVWRKEIMNPRQIAELYPQAPPALRRELEEWQRKYRNPRKSLPFPHLAWHLQPLWLSKRTRFPVIGIECLIRSPVKQFHAKISERVHNIRPGALNLCLVFHIGDSPQENSLRCIPGNIIANSRMYDRIKRALSENYAAIMTRFEEKNYAETAAVALQTIHTAIDALGDTGFRMADDDDEN